MTFEKITLFTNNIELDSLFFSEVLVIEKFEINKSYNKFIINEVIYSINNRQKGLATNYFFEIKINKNEYEKIVTKINKFNLTIDIRLKDKLIFSLNNFIFSLSFIDSMLNDDKNYSLENISFVSSFDETILDANNKFLHTLKDKNEVYKLESDKFSLNIVNNLEAIPIYTLIKNTVSENFAISQNTPISIIINQIDKDNNIDENDNVIRLNLIFSGNSLVVTHL